jgi:hypothetical protein
VAAPTDHLEDRKAILVAGDRFTVIRHERAGEQANTGKVVAPIAGRYHFQ